MATYIEGTRVWLEGVFRTTVIVCDDEACAVEKHYTDEYGVRTHYGYPVSRKSAVVVGHELALPGSESRHVIVLDEDGSELVVDAASLFDTEA